MYIHNVKSYIEQNLSSKEKLIGFFYAHKSFKLWLYFIIGPLAVLSLKSYFVAVTNNGIHFFQFNLLLKFSKHDFFIYDEIEKVKVGKGVMKIPMQYSFTNGNKLKIKALKKGCSDVMKIEEKELEYIKRNIKSD